MTLLPQMTFSHLLSVFALVTSSPRLGCLWGHKSKHTFHEPLETCLVKFAPSLVI